MAALISIHRDLLGMDSTQQPRLIRYRPVIDSISHVSN